MGRTHQKLQLIPDEGADAIVAMVPRHTTLSMAMVPLGKCDSPEILSIDQRFHEYANMRVTEQSQHWIPDVVVLKFIRRCIGDVHCHPGLSTEKGEKRREHVRVD